MNEKSALSVRAVLESSALMRTLTEDEIMDLAAHCRLMKCPRSETIWLHGRDVGYFCLVARGFVKLTKPGIGGNELTLEIIGPGQIFGLLGVIDGEGCPLMAHALTNTIVLRIPNEPFLRVYKQNHELKEQLIRRTAIRMHQKLDLMSKLSTGKAEERIAAILFILADSYGEVVGKTVRINLPLTRQQIGEMAGTTTETTIRVLSRWSKMNLVETDQHVITLLDPDQIQLTFSESRPANA